MDKQKIKKYILEKLKGTAFLLLGFIVGGTISIYLSYASGNPGLIGNLFFLDGNQLFMSGSLAFKDGAIPGGKISNTSIGDSKLLSGITASKISGTLTNATISASKIEGKIDVSSLTGTLDISQLPDGVGGDAQTLSGKTVSEILDNSTDKIPTNKAVMDKISELLNCNANPNFNGYNLPFTNAGQETGLIYYTGAIVGGSYKANNNFKCIGSAFDPKLQEYYTNIKCNAGYYLSNGAIEGGIIKPICTINSCGTSSIGKECLLDGGDNTTVVKIGDRLVMATGNENNGNLIKREDIKCNTKTYGGKSGWRLTNNNDLLLINNNKSILTSYGIHTWPNSYFYSSDINKYCGTACQGVRVRGYSFDTTGSEYGVRFSRLDPNSVCINGAVMTDSAICKQPFAKCVLDI